MGECTFDHALPHLEDKTQTAQVGSQGHFSSWALSQTSLCCCLCVHSPCTYLMYTHMYLSTSCGLDTLLGTGENSVTHTDRVPVEFSKKDRRWPSSYSVVRLNKSEYGES